MQRAEIFALCSPFSVLVFTTYCVPQAEVQWLNTSAALSREKPQSCSVAEDKDCRGNREIPLEQQKGEVPAQESPELGA